MKTTARNQFPGIVQAVDMAPVSAQVVIALPSGLQIVAAMTRAAAERLKLASGKPVIALIKASSVVLVTDFDGYSLSARNQFPGTVTRIERGAVASFVTVAAQGGAHFSASLTNDAIDELGLKAGSAATAVFKAYSVMVAAKA